MEVKTCAICSRPILRGEDVVAFLDGKRRVAFLDGKRRFFDNDDDIHGACWKKVADWGPEWRNAANDRDSNGLPICPACKQPFRPGQFPMRSGTYMLHSHCAENTVLPMQLQVGDRFTDETGDWEVVSRPGKMVGGKTVRATVRKVGEPAVTEERTWSAYERVAVKRG